MEQKSVKIIANIIFAFLITALLTAMLHNEIEKNQNYFIKLLKAILSAVLIGAYLIQAIRQVKKIRTAQFVPGFIVLCSTIFIMLCFKDYGFLIPPSFFWGTGIVIFLEVQKYIYKIKSPFLSGCLYFICYVAPFLSAIDPTLSLSLAVWIISVLLFPSMVLSRPYRA
jgi:hypothetical protein